MTTRTMKTSPKKKTSAPAKKSQGRRGVNGPPKPAGVKGRDSIDSQEGLREFLDALYEERVEIDGYGHEGQRRRLTIDEIRQRVIASGKFTLSRRKVGEDRRAIDLEVEIALAAQRRVIALARGLVAEGGDDLLVVQRATNQLLATKLAEAAHEAETLGEGNAWIVPAAATVGRTAARLETVHMQRDRQLARAESRVVAALRKRLEGTPKLLAALLEHVPAAVEEAREELNR